MQVLTYAGANDDHRPRHRVAVLILVLTVLVNAIDDAYYAIRFFDSWGAWSAFMAALGNWDDRYAIWVSRPILLFLDVVLLATAWFTRSRYPLVALVGLHCVFEMAPDLLRRDFSQHHWSVAMLSLTYLPANLLCRWLPAIVASTILLFGATRAPLRVAANGVLVYCGLQVLNVLCWRLLLPESIPTIPINRTSALLEPYTQFCLFFTVLLALPVLLRWWHWMVWTSWVILVATVIETFIPLTEGNRSRVGVYGWLELLIGIGSAALWSGVWWFLLRIKPPAATDGLSSPPRGNVGIA